ncbi:MAG TPA: enoyl-CoA hydratase/isomerase family protein [Allosphingosinicella sp.]|jgi:enoyl-CoA hydratase/carnithine racemase
MFQLTTDNGLARLQLQRPEACNAIPLDGWKKLERLFDQVQREGARLLILSGGPQAFCAGADLGDFPLLMADAEAASRFRIDMRDACLALRDLPIPTVALIEGPCFGAGAALAMACDLRIAGEGVSFAITPAKFGISYPQEDIARLVSLVGPGQASRLLFGAGVIDASEALRIGLVEIGPPANANAAADAFSQAVLANSAGSLETLKRGLALAISGTSSDEEQDRRFDSLFSGEALRQRLPVRAS